MKVGIIGVGLIGGSIARALRRRAIPLWMDDADAPTQEAIRAHQLGHVGPWREWVTQVDQVVVAVPLPRVPELVADLATAMRPSATLVELSSLKIPLLPSLAAAAEHVGLLSLHFMAGREVSGFTASREDLFADAPAIAVNIGAPADPILLRWWRENLGSSEFVVREAATHDAAMAWVSQLPYLVSRALRVCVEAQTDPEALALAGPGFWDSVRVGRGDWLAVEPMLRANRGDLSRALVAVESTLSAWRESLNDPNEEIEDD